MLTEALIVGFVIAFAKFIDWYGLGNQLARPIIIVPFLGLMLGHLEESIVLGAQLELIFLGNVSLGGVMPSDITLGALFGAAFTMILDSSIESAIALAVPISLLGTLIYSMMKITVTALVPRFEKLIEERKLASFNRLWAAQAFGYLFIWFLVGFLAIFVGTDAVKSLIEAIPTWVQSSMSVAATMLPAVGLALLLKMLWQKSLAPYFFLGFGLGAFLLYQKATSGTVTDDAVAILSEPTKVLSLVQIAFFGFIIAAIVVMSELRYNKLQNVKSQNSGTSGDDLEDFFDE
ncbi:PTS system, mannose-specific IIC component [Enterococcus sp. AZ194]|uniref:PTS mannose/fructose/sorbose/N-acetylgalactosamine transporter subunit IIC n=1 Tax=Enterococcus sp. AZ194 TaxID=2774629 RepID=UPI003F23ED3B